MLTENTPKLCTLNETLGLSDAAPCFLEYRRNDLDGQWLNTVVDLVLQSVMNEGVIYLHHSMLLNFSVTEIVVRVECLLEMNHYVEGIADTKVGAEHLYC